MPMDGTRNELKAVLGIFLGTLACIVAVIFTVETAHFVRSSAIAPAHVVRLTYGSRHADAVFTTQNGEQVELPVSTLGAMRVGDIAEVRYDPRHPQAGAQLNSFFSLWMAQALFGVVGVISILSGVQRLRQGRSSTSSH
jgi:hypothetical protein